MNSNSCLVQNIGKNHKEDQFRSITNEAKALYMIFNKMLRELEAHNLIYQSHQGLGKPNKIYVYDLLKADNSNWLPKQFKNRKGQTAFEEV